MQRFLRNAAIGAIAASYRALFYKWWDVFGILLALGALSGVLYTLLEPLVRQHPRFHYVPYILGFYLVIFGGIGVGVLRHDEWSLDALTSPWGIGFFLIAGAIGGYVAGRTFEDKSPRGAA